MAASADHVSALSLRRQITKLAAIAASATKSTATPAARETVDTTSSSLLLLLFATGGTDQYSLDPTLLFIATLHMAKAPYGF
jgi:hypothetical protein